MSSTTVKNCHSLFDAIFANLKQELDEAVKKTDSWANMMIDEIKLHSENQKKVLQKLHDEEKRHIESSLRTAILTVEKRQKEKDFDGINTLLEQCKRLKRCFYTQRPKERTISFFYHRREEASPEKITSSSFQRSASQISSETNSSRTLTSNNKNSRVRLNTLDSSFELVDNADRQSVEYSSMNEFHSDDSQPVAIRLNAFDECPICHFLFPQHLSVEQRAIHCSQHD